MTDMPLNVAAIFAIAIAFAVGCIVAGVKHYRSDEVYENRMIRRRRRSFRFVRSLMRSLRTTHQRDCFRDVKGVHK